MITDKWGWWETICLIAVVVPFALLDWARLAKLGCRYVWC